MLDAMIPFVESMPDGAVDVDARKVDGHLVKDAKWVSIAICESFSSFSPRVGCARKRDLGEKRVRLISVKVLTRYSRWEGVARLRCKT